MNKAVDRGMDINNNKPLEDSGKINGYSDS